MTQDQLFQLRFAHPERYVIYDDLDPSMVNYSKIFDCVKVDISKKPFRASTAEKIKTIHQKLASQFIKAKLPEPEFELVCINLSGKVIWSNELPKIGEPNGLYHRS